MAEDDRSLTPALVAAPAGGGEVAHAPVPGHLTGAQTGWTLYEVNIEIDPAVAAQFDAWLPSHVDEILGVTGFAYADILVREDVSEGHRAGWQRRTVLYRIRERAQLDVYLAEHAERMRADAQQRFGERACFERRALTQSAHRSPGQVELEYCPNCGAVLSGQYCATCGQRSRVRIVSLWHLIREAAGDLTHLDSRLWHTMGPLLFRPGVLTNEYLAGRRARFIPPFRLYLGLSIVFFVLASLSSSLDDTRVVMDGNLDDVPGLTDEDRAQIAQAVGESKEIGEELRRRGVAVPGSPGSGNAAAPGSDPVSGATPADAGPAPLPGPQSAIATASKAIGESGCDRLEVNIDMPGRAGFEQRARRACSKIIADEGHSFLRALATNVPKMMFVFLPLLALANKALYPFARRYYVEHLLFFVHYHAFVFLLFSLLALFDMTTDGLTGFTAVRGVLLAVIAFYLPIYLYKALRRVFGQGRLATLFKFTLLFVAYNICLVLTLIGMVVYTMFTM